MIKRGSFYCCRCARVSSESWFKVEENTYVHIENKKGSRKPWGLTEHVGEKGVKYNLVSVEESKFSKMPKRIVALKNGKEELVSQTRVCPYCMLEGQETKYFPFAGELNTYILAILGPTDCGKTSYLRSLLSEEGEHSLAKLIPGALLMNTNVKIGATLLNTPGDRLSYIIRVYENGRPKYDILFRDTPGELFYAKHIDTKDWRSHINIFRKDGHYAGVDAVMMLGDESTTIYADKLGDVKKERELAIDEVLSNIPFEIPFAITLSKSDKYIELMQQKGVLTDLDGRVVLNQASNYLFKDYANMEQAERNMVLTRHIFPAFGNYIRRISVQRPKWAGFFLSNGPSQGEKGVDSERAFGLANPLLYLLDQFKVYDYPDDF